jgi:3' terminal RNA ribose 2'-O-methyltransferase Hen1
MLLTITTTHRPATDLGYLLHKSPGRVHTFELPFGQAHVFYPEATTDRCTVALLLEVDPVGLVRNRKGPSGEQRALEQYVNDRPYVASSFLSVALSRSLHSALGGRSKERQELADTPIPLEARLTVLPCRGGEVFLRRLFEPLGYEVSAAHSALDTANPDWGDSRYFTVTLRAEKRLQDLLTHLYVLVPVMDDDKHYWVGDDEVEKLLRHGEGWLSGHPEKESIARRYLKHRRGLVREALARLVEEEDVEPEADETKQAEETILEERLSLNEQRLKSVVNVLSEQGASRILDLGCGEGKLLRELLRERRFSEIVGMDVSYRALEIAQERLGFDRMGENQRKRIQLIHGSLMYRDKRLSGYDAATVVEVIEHLDAPRLSAFERTVFDFARPATIVVTTPNVEYNVLFPTLAAGKMRHRDHRFEWTRAEFQSWADRNSSRFGYAVRFLPVGPVDPSLGPPTQMAVFTR